jgi:phosphoribosyl 1,2-cyclic phosphodiesterase
MVCRFKFWGVRGSIPTPGPSTVYFGGNTSCIEVRADGEIIILDAGTGIRPLGLALAQEFAGKPINLTLLISHAHWDHIQGFPFFLPAYDAKNQIRVLGYEGARIGLANTLAGQMESPYFPIALKEMPGNIMIEELKEMQFSVGAVKAAACLVNHPGLAVGYRLFTSGGSLVYLPDNEPASSWAAAGDATHSLHPATAKSIDRKLIDFIRGADALIIDSQYDEAEYARHVGWGHGCVTDVVDLAVAADVKRLFLFHHDPNHDDDYVRRMLADARELAAAKGASVQIDAAREGEEIVLDSAKRDGGRGE